MVIILFICKKNAYRSQLAEALFNSMAKRNIAISASGAEPSKEINRGAVEILKETYGIDMSKQRPKILTEEMLEKAARIITVCDPNDCILLPKRYNAEHWNIPEFEGLDDESKIKALRLLHGKVKTLVKELEGEK